MLLHSGGNKEKKLRSGGICLKDCSCCAFAPVICWDWAESSPPQLARSRDSWGRAWPFVLPDAGALGPKRSSPGREARQGCSQR